MTQLDEAFVAKALQKHPEAAHYINTLAEEVRRLERLGLRYEEALHRIGKTPNVGAIAREAIHPIDPAVIKDRVGPNVLEQLQGQDDVPEETTLVPDLNGGAKSVTRPPAGDHCQDVSQETVLSKGHVLEACDQTVWCSVCQHAEWMDDHLPDECPGPPVPEEAALCHCGKPVSPGNPTCSLECYKSGPQEPVRSGDE